MLASGVVVEARLEIWLYTGVMSEFSVHCWSQGRSSGEAVVDGCWSEPFDFVL